MDTMKVDSQYFHKSVFIRHRLPIGPRNLSVGKNIFIMHLNFREIDVAFKRKFFFSVVNNEGMG